MGFELPFDQEIFPWQQRFRRDMTQALAELAARVATRKGAHAQLRHALCERAQREWREAIGRPAWSGSASPLQQDQLSRAAAARDHPQKLRSPHPAQARLAGRARHSAEATPVTEQEIAAMIRLF